MRVCCRCHRKFDEQGYKTCRDCRERASSNYKVRRRYLLSKGLCPYCGKTKLDGGKMCDNCRLRTKVSHIKFLRKAAAAGKEY